MNPIIADGVMYVYGRNNSLIALDAATGKEIWIHTGLSSIAELGVNYWDSKDGKDRRLIFQINHFLEEIDARTGKSILSFGEDGLVDMREGLDRVPAEVARIKSDAPGRVFENLIIEGSSTGENFLAPPGHIRAYDVITGKSRVDVSHRPLSRRIRLRHLAEGCLAVHRRGERLGRAFAR